MEQKLWVTPIETTAYTIEPAGSTIEREPSGIIESYEKVMKIFKRSSPMSNWSDITMALHELGHSIYGDRR